MTPLSRSAPTNLYLVHTDHAYQVMLLRVSSTDCTDFINVEENVWILCLDFEKPSLVLVGQKVS